VRLVGSKPCEDCGLKTPHYGVLVVGAQKQNRRWCGPCARVGHPEAINLSEQKCEICGLKQASFVLPPSTRKQWCAGCAGAAITHARARTHHIGHTPPWQSTDCRLFIWCAGS